MTTAEEAATIIANLAPVERARLLARLCVFLSVSARGEYPEARDGDLAAVRRLCCINELVQDVSAQLRDILLDEPGYPDDVFFRGLDREASREQGCKFILEWSITEAVKRTASRPQTGEP